jgi:hypothetical protein
MKMWGLLFIVHLFRFIMRKYMIYFKIPDSKTLCQLERIEFRGFTLKI